MAIGVKVDKFILLAAKTRALQRENEDHLKQAGVYAIVNKRNGHKYIGQSVDMAKRKQHHFTALSKGNHGNPHLQSAYNKYGPAEWDFVVLETCRPANLDEVEQRWINEHGYYNVVLDVKNPGDRRVVD